MKTNQEQNSSACKFIFPYGQVRMSINDHVYRADKLKKNIIKLTVCGSRIGRANIKRDLIDAPYI